MSMLFGPGRQRTSMRRWVESLSPEIAKIPRPSDAPQVHSAGVDADRILIAGTGLALGYGAATHDEALPGTLARALSDVTGRGTDVDVIPDPHMTVRSAAARLAEARLWRFDLLVLTLGINESLDLEPAREWRRSLRTLLTALEPAMVGGSRIALLDVGPIESLSVFSGPRAAQVDAHSAALDAASEEVAAEFESVRFVRLSPPRTEFGAVADELVDAILDDVNSARAVNRSLPSGPAGSDSASRDDQRQRALEELGILDTPPEDRFDRIVDMAQRLFGTDGAAFTIIDGGRVWHKARINVPEEVPRDASFCDMTIRGRGIHVIPDIAKATELPADLSTAKDIGVAFYAGYPVESPSGEPIGALCVFDAKPRLRANVDEGLLRQLALLIQAELRVESLSA